MPQSELTVPDGAREGDVLHVNTPDGLAVDVAIPAGVAAGETFVFEYELPQPLPADSSLMAAAIAADGAPPPPPPTADTSLLMEAVRARRLTPENATALHGIMESLYDFDELDEYIDDHCGLFVDYVGGAEQRLEYTACHLEYVRLVEARIAQYLALLGATSDQLYEMLAEVAAGDERAVAFLDRLLGMGDYAHFAQSMRAGGNRLKVSGLDLEQLTGGLHADMALYV